MAQPSKVPDMTFMFLMLNVHKQGAWDFQTIADKLGLGSAKPAESRYYKLKKAHWDTAAGTELRKAGDSTATPKKDKKPASKAPPTSKKRQLETDGDDEGALVDVEGKDSSKKCKAEVGGDDQEAAKSEGASDDAWA